ncbi:NAD(P)/FAD-dependent oxidoreductase [Halomonas sp. NCCP-2165]|nr:FAD-binding oxidoreductase [Halomonas sp. NCCP-2165]GKW49899.1 D-amino-acid oxidase [Halomonas sp. NCCP-2165]
MASQQTSVAIIGGGVIGVSIAVHLLRQGAPVSLFTEGELVSGASGRSLSWLNSAGERSREYHALRMAGIDRYRTLHAQDPGRDWLRFDGGLFWANDDDTGTRARHAYEKAHAYHSHLIGAEGVARLTPNVNIEAVADAATFNPGEGWVSLPHLIEHLMQEFRELGGELIAHCGKASVTRDESGHANGVDTERAGHHPVDRVVVACGAQTPEVVAPLGVSIPNASPLSMLVVTTPLEHGVECVMNTPRAAIRPNPASSLAVDHDWYEEHIEGDENSGYRIPEAVIEELLDEASRLVKGSPRLEAESHKIGYKPIPGDGEPVLGELEAVPGCFVAFTHSGATLALVVGELLADEILSGAKNPMLETFRPERFGT